MGDSLKHIEFDELKGCQGLRTTKLLSSGTFASLATNSEGRNDENFPFVLLVPSTATSKCHRGNQDLQGANRVVNRYSLQPRYKPRQKPRHKDTRRKPTSVKTKLPSTRVLLSGYNDRKEEWKKFHRYNRDVALQCCSPPRRRSQPELHMHNTRNSDLPSVTLLARRPMLQDQFVTPKKRDVLDLSLENECLPLLPLLL